jgi:hypothetical protein
MLQTGIIACKNTWPAWAHERVKKFLLRKVFKGEGTLPYPIYHRKIKTQGLDGLENSHDMILPRLR